MKPLLPAVMMIPLLLCAAPQADFEKEFATTAGKKLEVDLETGGGITIVGWDKELVAVKGIRERGDGEDAELKMEESSSGVFIGSRFAGTRRARSGGVRLEVNVPQRYDLQLETNGGAISVDNVDGTIEGRTMGGALELSRLKGSLDLMTMGGPVNLKDSDVGGEVKTMGGEVRLVGVSGSVRGRSMGGKVIQENGTGGSSEAKRREVNISTMGGDVNVDDAPLGASVQTMGGDITVKSAAGFVKARTMGGDIVVEAVDGWVDVTTMGGDVAVTMTGDPAAGKRDVTLASMGGEVTLHVPAALSMSFDVELTYTRDHRGEHRIISDFPLRQEETPEWEEGNGSPRKIIRGTGEVAGGRHRIRIKTINGNVTVKKI